MKKFKVLFMVTIPMWSLNVLAQASPSPSPSPVGNTASQAPEWLVNLFVNHPKLLALLAIVGFLRIVLKPTFTWLHQVLPASGLVAWDQSVTAVEVSKPMKVVYFILDYLGSIKMPVKQDDPTQPPKS